MRIPLICFAFGVATASCTTENLTFCDEETPCPSGFRCAIERSECAADDVAPRVTSLAPKDGADEVPITTQIEIAFSEAVVLPAETNDVLVLASGKRRVEGTPRAEASRLIFKPRKVLAPKTTYEVTLEGAVRDEAGNPLEKAVSWTFTTSSGPIVTETRPADGATGVPVGAAIEVVFSDRVDPETLTPESFSLVSAGGPVAGAFEVDERRVTFQPAEPLEPDTTYEGTLQRTIKGLDGYALQEAVGWSFRTAARPRVIARSPASGAKGVPYDAIVSVTFDGPLDETSVDENALVLSAASAVLGGAVRLSDDKTTIVFEPAQPLADSATYTVALGAELRNSAGVPLGTAETWTFTALDSTPPTVAQTSPMDGGSEAPTDRVTVLFSEPIEAASAANALSLRLIDKTGAQSEPVPGTTTVDGPTLIFTPATPLALAAKYSAELATDVKDGGGNPLSAATRWSFSTRDGQWAAAPERIEPADGKSIGSTAVALDAGGNALVVWVEQLGSERSLLWSRRLLLGQSWQEAAAPARVDPHEQGRVRLTSRGLASSRDGRAIAAWGWNNNDDALTADPRSLYARVFDPRQGWSASPELLTVPATDVATAPGAEIRGFGVPRAVSSGERWLVVWEASDQLERPWTERSTRLMARAHDGNVWAPQRTVAPPLPPPNQSTARLQALSMNAAGSSIAVFRMDSVMNGKPSEAILTDHGEPGTLLISRGISLAGVNDVALDAQGNAIAVGRTPIDDPPTGQSVCVSRYSSTTKQWTEVRTLSELGPSPDPGNVVTDARVSYVSADEAVLAWAVIKGRQLPWIEVAVATLGGDEKIRSAKVLASADNLQGLSLMTDASGNSLLVWGEINVGAEWRLWAVRRRPGVGWEEPQLLFSTTPGQTIDRLFVEGTTAANSERGNALLVWSTLDRDPSGTARANSSRLMSLRFE